MARAFSQIAFTPGVRAVQERMGSRANYAPLDHATDRHDRLTGREAAFIEARDGFYQATVGSTGWPYVQFRGGPAGFLKVLDSKTIAYADFRGNVQYISVGNLEADNRVSIILMDYANQARLKLLGRVRLVDAASDPALIDALRMPGYAATIERAFVITVEAYDWNCPQHITPRFTEAEIERIVAPMRQQIASLRAAASAGAGRARASVLGSGALRLKITALKQLTPRVRAYELRRIDGAPLPEISAGAHVALPVYLPDGTVATRHYSIASDPRRRDVWEVAVLHVPDGRGGSASLHEAYTLGLQLNVDAPANHFALHGDARPALLIGAGIGITPLRAMARELAAQGRRFALHLAARSRAEAPYVDELEASLGRQFTLHAKDQGQRLDVQALLEQAPADAVIYVCGPDRLIDDVRATAARLNVSEDRLRFERFAPRTAAADDRPVRLRLARSGRVIEVGAQDSLLDAVNAAGVGVPSSCRTGSCGTCAVKVVAGEPLHRDVALSTVDRTQHRMMCLCVSRAQSEELALDL